MDLFNQENNGAIFSKCRKYRYVLWRIWDYNKPSVQFIGLNPSTANENSDDPTIRRIKKFAYEWGYGAVYMTNLFAYVTAYPKELKTCENPLGDNDKWLKETSTKCEKVVFAWGSFKEAEERVNEVIKMFDGHALIINQDGSPRHPLYVKSNTKPIKFNP